MKEIKIALPNHKDMEGIRICHECASEMLPCTISRTFQMKNAKVTITNVKAYKCMNCGEVIYLSSEVKLMENAFPRIVQLNDFPSD